jgi:hypothetical protein
MKKVPKISELAALVAAGILTIAEARKILLGK